MARNVEIKARVDDLDAVAAAACAIGATGPTAIAQDDTFFRCADGRLKLRRFSATAGELIFYRRSDDAGPKTSFYVRTPTADPDGLREALALALGTLGRVRKQRQLYLLGRTRVHLDRVEGLGEFVELEVVLADGEPAESGEDEARRLMQRLGITPARCLAGAYLDLIGPGSPHGDG